MRKRQLTSGPIVNSEHHCGIQSNMY